MFILYTPRFHQFLKSNQVGYVWEADRSFRVFITSGLFGIAALIERKVNSKFSLRYDHRFVPFKKCWSLWFINHVFKLFSHGVIPKVISRMLVVNMVLSLYHILIKYSSDVFSFLTIFFMIWEPYLWKTEEGLISSLKSTIIYGLLLAELLLLSQYLTDISKICLKAVTILQVLLHWLLRIHWNVWGLLHQKE